MLVNNKGYRCDCGNAKGSNQKVILTNLDLANHKWMHCPARNIATQPEMAVFIGDKCDAGALPRV